VPFTINPPVDNRSNEVPSVGITLAEVRSASTSTFPAPTCTNPPETSATLVAAELATDETVVAFDTMKPVEAPEPVTHRANERSPVAGSFTTTVGVTNIPFVDVYVEPVFNTSKFEAAPNAASEDGTIVNVPCAVRVNAVAVNWLVEPFRFIRT
jgi:hypothetical protein